MSTVPEKTFMPGWPEYLSDVYGMSYVRLRDGVPTSEFGGHACLYGLYDCEGSIDRAHQWIPVLGATGADMRLTGGEWMDPEQFVQMGLPPITIPPEPITYHPKTLPSPPSWLD